MNQNPFEKVAKIFYAENQEQLETAMWGHSLNNRQKRDYIKQMVLEQIEDSYKVRDKAMAQIQLGIVQMGLGEPWAESGYSILTGIELSLSGNEHDIIDLTMTGCCVLVYWTNKADETSQLRCCSLLGYMGRKIQSTRASRDTSVQSALMFPNAWLAVFSSVWGQVIDRETRGGISRRSVSFNSCSQAAEAIDSFTRHQMSVYDWMISRLKFID